MAEIKYESVRKWLDAAGEKRVAGHLLISVDDPVRRVFAFVDDNSDVHLIGLQHVYGTKNEMTPAEKEALKEPETRKALVEKGTT